MSCFCPSVMPGPKAAHARLQPQAVGLDPKITVGALGGQIRALEQHDTGADFYFAGHDHDVQVLSERGAPLLVISGAAAQTRPTKTGPRTEFASSELGFAHVQLDKKSAKLEILDSAGEPKFNKTITKP